MSLPKCERNILPDIKIYPTLIASIADNFDIYSEETDCLVEEFVEGATWGYSRIAPKYNNRKRFISISTGKPRMCFENVPPEVTLFHEIGHFQVNDILNETYTDSSMVSIEKKCDRYALCALVRMLYRLSAYATPYNAKKYKALESNIRKRLVDLIPDNSSESDKYTCFKIIADDIYKRLDWDSLYIPKLKKR